MQGTQRNKRLDQLVAELTVDTPIPHLRHPFRIVTIGRSGKGKTTLIISILLSIFMKFFHRIWVFSPSIYSDPKWKLLSIPKERKFTSVSRKKIYEIMLEMTKWRNEAKKKGEIVPRGLIIFDDCGAEKEMRGHLYANPVDFLNFNCRWNGLSCIHSVQNLKSLSVPTRTNNDGTISYYPENTLQKKSLWEDYGFGDFKEFKQFLDFALPSPEDFLYINRFSKETLYYRNFDTQLKIEKKFPGDSEELTLNRKRKRDNQCLPSLSSLKIPRTQLSQTNTEEQQTMLQQKVNKESSGTL
jgi:hypothetical protein